MADMKDKKARKLVAVKVDKLKDNTATNFDLFAAIDGNATSDDNVILYAKNPYNWSLRELTDLSRIGIQDLFVKEEDAPRYERYVKLNHELPEIDPALAPKFRIRQLQDLGSHLIEISFITELDRPLLDRIENVAREVVKCLVEDPKCVSEIESLADHDLYTYVHSVGVGTLSAAIALTMGERDPAVLQMFALGGLLHDVGKKKVPLGVLNKSGPLNNEEWEIMKQHPAYGLELLDGLGVAKEIQEIVGLHHEKLDGSGYPNGLVKGAIPRHVQIATVADIFNALTTARCYHFKRSRFEALMFMKHNLSGKISPEVFKALVGSLIQEESISKAT